ncbi:Cysteine protease family C48 [Phytophthora palmivora]|uniref:Cysteine protease family C48 n=1 Tax=Phytophthora palmivora TaxID=4796 RepID=A0A2P4YBX1_9STRA|nr:Cysteine protease family C48 [Phytophthora palmivora]
MDAHTPAAVTNVTSVASDIVLEHEASRPSNTTKKYAPKQAAFKQWCNNLTLEEKLEKLRTWRDHPEWCVCTAARELNAATVSLFGWKKQYWEILDTKVDSKDAARKRAKGGGRRHKMYSYEWEAMAYYDDCDGKCSRADLLKHCRRIKDFAILNDNTQKRVYNAFFEQRIKGELEAAERLNAEDSKSRADGGIACGGEGDSVGSSTGIHDENEMCDDVGNLSSEKDDDDHSRAEGSSDDYADGSCGESTGNIELNPSLRLI